MRKKAVLAAMCVCAAFVCGCEKTPEDVIVREKGAQSIQKYESGEAGEGSLAKRLGAPAHYKNRAVYEDGRLVIDTDADVFVPDVEDVHTYAVTAKEETQELVDGVTEIFFPGAKFYDGMENPYNYTKEYYQEKLTQLKKYKAEGNLDPYGYGKDENGEYRLPIDMQIASCEENIKSAPKESELKEVTPTLPSGESFEESWFIGNAVTENGNYSYYVSYDPSFMAGIDFNIGKSWDDGIGVEYEDGEYFLDVEDMSYGKRKWSEEEVKKFVRIPYEAAEKTAKEKVEKLGMDLALYGWDYRLWWRAGADGVRENNILDGGYVFYFTRELDGIPVTYTNDTGAGIEGDMETATTIPWRYEWCNLAVGGDGNIREAEICNPYEIGEIQTENVKLMDFDSIIDIYEQMMEISGAGSISDWENLRTYNIRKITFGYARIYNPEVDSTSGILVPVWDFFGEFDSQDDEGESIMSGEHSTRSMMTINAIDGSLIDRELGY